MLVWMTLIARGLVFLPVSALTLGALALALWAAALARPVEAVAGLLVAVLAGYGCYQQARAARFSLKGLEPVGLGGLLADLGRAALLWGAPLLLGASGHGAGPFCYTRPMDPLNPQEPQDPQPGTNPSPEPSPGASQAPQAAPPPAAEEGGYDTVSPLYGVLGVILRPSEYFSSMTPGGGYGKPVARIALWSFLGSVVGFAYAQAGMGTYPLAGPGAGSAAALGLVLGPLFGVAGAFIGAGVFHMLCKLLGGQGRYQASFRIVAALSVLSPLSALLSPLPFSFILVQLWALSLTVTAAASVHSVRKGPAWGVFGVVTLLVIGLGVFTQTALRLAQEEQRESVRKSVEGAQEASEETVLNEEDPEEVSPAASGEAGEEGAASRAVQEAERQLDDGR